MVVYHVSMATRGADISSFWLKVAAIVAMTCNHVANVFAGTLPPLAALGLYALGGMTFPIMAFLLVEGYAHTSSVRRYALRLAGFAVVAQVPYALLWGATPNVLFTLLVSLGVLAAKDRLGSPALFALVTGAAAIATFPFDWGLVGVPLVVLFRLLRDQPRGLLKAMAIPFLAIGAPSTLSLAGLGGAALDAISSASTGGIAGFPSPADANTIAQLGHVMQLWGDAGYALVGFSLATVLICHYGGRRGRPMKWFFYAYYPAHLAVLWMLKTLIA